MLQERLMFSLQSLFWNGNNSEIQLWIYCVWRQF